MTAGFSGGFHVRFMGPSPRRSILPPAAEGNPVKRTLLSLTLAVAMLAAACGSGDTALGLASLDDASASADAAVLDGDDAPVADVSAEEAMLALAECLREQGLEVQDPELDDDGFPRMREMFGPLLESGEIDREGMRAAMESCSEYAEAIRTQFGAVDRSEIEDSLYEYAACMRANGYDMPDPDFSTEPGQGQGQGGGGPFGELDPDDPAFQAANEVCQDLFGGIRPGGGGPGGGPGRGGPGA